MIEKKQYEIFCKDLKTKKSKNITLFSESICDAKRNFFMFYPDLDILCVFPAKFSKIQKF